MMVGGSLSPALPPILGNAAFALDKHVRGEFAEAVLIREAEIETWGQCIHVEGVRSAVHRATVVVYNIAAARTVLFFFLPHR